MFSIQFDPTSLSPGNPGEYARGFIDFRPVDRQQYFTSSLYQWNLQEYQKHWLEAIRRIVDGQESSVLITDLPKLTRRNLIDTWPMWRFGETVKFQEHLLILRNLSGPFDPANPYVHVGDYNGETDEDGHRSSEWEVSVSDIAAFLEAQAKVARE